MICHNDKDRNGILTVRKAFVACSLELKSIKTDKCLSILCLGILRHLPAVLRKKRIYRVGLYPRSILKRKSAEDRRKHQSRKAATVPDIKTNYKEPNRIRIGLKRRIRICFLIRLGHPDNVMRSCFNILKLLPEVIFTFRSQSGL